MRLIFTSCLLAFVTACSTPFHPPIFAVGSTEFGGIGGAMRTSSPVDVVLVHGMCTHDDADADRAMLEIAGAIDKNVRELPTTTNLRTESLNASPQVHVYDRELPVAGSTLRFHALMSSGMTTPLKRQLDYDRTGDPTDCSAVPSARCKPLRAKYNGIFKDGLLDDCLADALIYQGASHRAIKAQMVAAMTQVMSGMDDVDRPLMLVSASLGSKMAFDALADMLDAPEGSAAKLAARRLAKRLAIVYMEANQLPILGLADQDVGQLESQAATAASTDLTASRPAVGSLQRFLDKRSKLPSLSRADELKIVAFSDPNDLLSFRLMESRYAGHERVAIADVLVSNSSTYLGLFENPLNAHLGYALNPDVARLIACGRPVSPICR